MRVLLRTTPVPQPIYLVVLISLEWQAKIIKPATKNGYVLEKLETQTELLTKTT